MHKYLHSRLMHFDVPTLYEMHYNSITLGKVRPNQDITGARPHPSAASTLISMCRLIRLLSTIMMGHHHDVRVPAQVFCSKQQPRCGTCPLRSMCEYALHKGPCMAAPLTEIEARSQPAEAADPTPAADSAAEADDATQDGGGDMREEASESHGGAAQRSDSEQAADPEVMPQAIAALRAAPAMLTAADREAHVTRILAAAVVSQPERTEQAAPSKPEALDPNRRDSRVFQHCGESVQWGD